MNSEKVKEIKKALECMSGLCKDSLTDFCFNCEVDKKFNEESACKEALTLINELEKENAIKTDTIVDLLKKQEFYEKEKLTKFAEMLKEHPTMKIYSLHNACERIPKAIDETLKEFINNQEYENNTTNIRLETLKDFREKYKEALKEAVKGENVNCFVESLKIFDKTIEEKICDLK